MKKFRYNYLTEEHRIAPSPKHATISVLTFKKDKLSEQDNYLNHVMEEHFIVWQKVKQGDFEAEWLSIIERLNAQFNNRGKNIAMECLQFGGNNEFWEDFPNEEEILSYFKHCYLFAIHYVGYMSTDKNIICAVIITEGRRRNLFVYYLPITEKWEVKSMSRKESEKGNKLQQRNESGNPIYKQIGNRYRPLLCHSEFWKQRGGLTSFSDLQEDFYMKISKRYGSERGISKSRLKNTALAQRERFNRKENDEYDLMPPIKTIWV